MNSTLTKPLLAIAFTLLLHTLRPATAQPAGIQRLLDTSMAIMKNHAVNAATANWNRLQQNAYSLANGINDPYQLGPVFRYLFQAIHDFHGAFFYKDSMFQWQQNAPVLSDSIMTEFKKGVSVKTMLLDQQFGYLRIPSMPIFSAEEFSTRAQQLNDSLCTLLDRNIRGIIIDLRLNGGGAMHPMILGVRQLLSEGPIGGFRGSKNETWLLTSNRFMVDSAQIAKIVPRCNTPAHQLPVVILTSPVTGSAAECFIIAFKGRENTMVLGSKTAGFVTANQGFPINEHAGMNLAVGYSADRLGKVYKEAINPDIAFQSKDLFNDIANDPKVNAAVN